MNPTNELFELVKSLNSSEKRYFKLSASLQRGYKNYVRLFEALDSQKAYDEKLFKEKFKNEKFISNFNFNKNYLSKLIYRSLQQYTNEHSLDAKLFGLLCKSRILFDKALFGQYFKSVKHGKKISSEFEKFSYLIEFLELERQLAKKEDLPKYDINKIYDQEIDVIDKIRNINILKRRVSALLMLKRIDGVIRSSRAEKLLNDIMEAAEFENENDQLSLTAKERYYFSRSLDAEIRGCFYLAYAFQEKRFNLISDNKKIFDKFIVDNENEAHLALIQAAVSIGDFKTSEKLYRQFFLKIKTPNDKVNFELMQYQIILAKGLKEEIKVNNMDKIVKFLNRYRGKLNIDTFNQMHFDTAKLYLLQGNFGEALNVTNSTLDSKYLKYTPYLEPYFRVLNLMIHYELGNYRLLKYLISSTEKFLKSKNKLFKTEQLLLTFFKDSVKAKSNISQSAELLNLKKKLNGISKNIFEKNGIELLSLNKWITLRGD